MNSAEAKARIPGDLFNMSANREFCGDLTDLLTVNSVRIPGDVISR